MKEFLIKLGLKLGIFEYKYRIDSGAVTESTFLTDDVYSSFLIAKANVVLNFYKERVKKCIVVKKSGRIIKTFPGSINYIIMGRFKFTDVRYYFYDDAGESHVFSGNEDCAISLCFPYNWVDLAEEPYMKIKTGVRTRIIDLRKVYDKECKFRYNLTEGDLGVFFQRKDCTDSLLCAEKYLQGVLPAVAENELGELHLSGLINKKGDIKQ